MMLFTKGDKVIIFTVLISALMIYLGFTFTVFAKRPQMVEIFFDGKPYANYALSDIKGSKTVKIETSYGVNILEITPDGVRMTDASCPDKTDINSGKITKANQMIICIPNRISVKLSGYNADVDKVTH